LATIQLNSDFKEFLRLLSSRGVEYLLLGGYAVNYYGFVRATGDIDLWIRVSPENAEKIALALEDFGFTGLSPEIFLERGKIFRMGVPPARIEMLTAPSGVEFDASYARRKMDVIDGLELPIIGLEDLLQNKRASGQAPGGAVLPKTADALKIWRTSIICLNSSNSKTLRASAHALEQQFSHVFHLHILIPARTRAEHRFAKRAAHRQGFRFTFLRVGRV